MGDADGEVLIPAQDDWLDEALDAVDEGMEYLLMYMINVNNKTKEIMLSLKAFDIQQLLVIAMNVFMMPVVFSMLLYYYMTDIFQDSVHESWVLATASVMMLVSGAIGLPLHLYYLWKSYRIRQKLNIEIGNIRRLVPERLNSIQWNRELSAEDSFPQLQQIDDLSPEEEEILSQFERMLAIMPPTQAEHILREHFLQLSEEDQALIRSVPAVRSVASEAFSPEAENETQNGSESITLKVMNPDVQTAMSIPETSQLQSIDVSKIEQDVKKTEETFENTKSESADSKINCVGHSGLEQELKSIEDKLECLEFITASISA